MFTIIESDGNNRDRLNIFTEWHLYKVRSCQKSRFLSFLCNGKRDMIESASACYFICACFDRAVLKIQQKDNNGWDRLDYFTGMALIYSAFVSKITILTLSLPKEQEPLLGAL